jgi:hypothetical protein
MQKITLSADEPVMDLAREGARESSVHEYETLLRDLRESGVRTGRRFTREEMNER